MGIAAVTTLPWDVELATVAVCCGAALLPDLDHPGATASRSLWIVTEILAKGVAGVSRLTYRATRGPKDKPSPGSGHRLLTHTVPGCALLAAVVAGVTSAGFVPAAVILGLLVALGAAGAPVIGATFTAGVVWLLTQHIPDVSSYWPLWGTATFVGCLAHIAGDCATISGCPVLWPVEIDGKRWRTFRYPLHSRAGSGFERWAIVPALLLICCWGAVGVFHLPAA